MISWRKLCDRAISLHCSPLELSCGVRSSSPKDQERIFSINGWVSLGTTTTRTGLELETPYLGVQAGLVEGVELHLLCMTIGVGIWPPQLKLPLLPGLPWGLAR